MVAFLPPALKRRRQRPVRQLSAAAEMSWDLWSFQRIRQQTPSVTISHIPLKLKGLKLCLEGCHVMLQR